MKTFTIYQEKDPTFRVDESKENYDMSKYDKVYTAKSDFPENFDTDEKILEYLFIRFQDHGYPFRSMSVGDIVELDGYFYIVQNFGFKNIYPYNLGRDDEFEGECDRCGKESIFRKGSEFTNYDYLCSDCLKYGVRE